MLPPILAVSSPLVGDAAGGAVAGEAVVAVVEVGIGDVHRRCDKAADIDLAALANAMPLGLMSHTWPLAFSCPWMWLASPAVTRFRAMALASVL